MAVYDKIGRTYSRTRQADPRIAAQIWVALDGAASVLNVGAGTGNYEPADRWVVALEPSMTMIRQRPSGAALAVQGVAGHLPFADRAFDAAMGTLTLHHWPDLGEGLDEVRRVSGRQVFMLYDFGVAEGFWLIDEYFPSVRALPSEQHAPTVAAISEYLDVRRVEPVLIPADCTDGFGCAFWNRPEAHLDPHVLAGMSWTSHVAPEVLAEGVSRLREDLETGRWDERHGRLRSMTEADYGYKLVIAGD
jgi:SAM-dependent methyltransferase